MSITSRAESRRLLSVALLGAAAAFGASSVPAIASEPPTLVSRASGAAGVKGNADSDLPSISADGRLVAFQTRATNLVPEDTDSIWDIFVRDRATDATTLVSRASGPAGVKGDADSYSPSISRDGRFVAFGSEADNLVPGVGDENGHVFVRDLLTGNIAAVDRAAGPDGAIGDRAAAAPSISAAGTHVVFGSGAYNLEPSGYAGLFVRDLTAHTTELVSRASGRSGRPGSGGSSSISADGTRVAFRSFSKYLAPNGAINPMWGAVFVRDLETHETILASRESGPNGRVSRIGAHSPMISANGRRVAFATNGENLHPRDRGEAEDVYVRDLKTGRTIYASRDLRKFRGERPYSASEPSPSANGRRVAFAVSYNSPATTNHLRVAVRDLKRRRTQLLPGVVTERIPDDPLFPTISGNGRWLAFQTRAGRVSNDDGDQILDVFAQRVRRRR